MSTISQQNSDQYLSISAPSTGLYKDNGSKFLAFAYPVESEEQVKEHLAALRKEYFDVYDGRIERMARAVIQFEWSMRDSDGKKQTGRDSDISWSVCIGGKWYVVPNVDEERTED